MKKLVSLAIVATLGMSASAHAGLISFNVGKTVTQGGNSSDYANTTVALPLSQFLTVDPGGAGSYLDLTLNGNGRFAVTSGASGLAIFSGGSVLSASNFLTVSSDPWGYALYGNNPMTGWNVSFTDKYLGFRTHSGNYGYVQANWTYNATTRVGQLTLGQGMLQDTAGVAITMGAAAVPEPATIALLGFGLLGAALARRNGRQRKG